MKLAHFFCESCSGSSSILFFVCTDIVCIFVSNIFSAFALKRSTCAENEPIQRDVCTLRFYLNHLSGFIIDVYMRVCSGIFNIESMCAEMIFFFMCVSMVEKHGRSFCIIELSYPFKV